MTASSSSPSRPRRSRPAVSSFRIPPKKKPSQGEVIAVGRAAAIGKLIPIDIKAGDRVLFGKWSSTEVKIDGQELLIMKESDIMGIMDEPAAKKKAA